MEKKQAKGLARWLQNLQQESWQLELLVSGFAIVLLVQGKESLNQLENYASVHLSSYDLAFPLISIIGMTVYGAWFILLVNLCIHVVLRGLWIGTIGLRSISSTIDFNKLNYSASF